MDKDFGINDKKELYKRVTPALNCKKRELEKYKVNYVNKEDIWNYLLKTKWKSVVGLDLSQMVDDILNLDNNKLIDFVSNKLNSSNSDNIVETEIELL